MLVLFILILIVCGFIFHLRNKEKIYEEPDFLNFIKYFLATSHNILDYDFIRNSKILLNGNKYLLEDLTVDNKNEVKSIAQSIMNDKSLKFIVSRESDDFKALRGRNGVDKLSTEMLVSVRFFKSDVLSLYKRYKKEGKLELLNISKESKLKTASGDIINANIVVNVKKFN